MSRALRIEFPGAVYHVMARGQRRDLIFRYDADCADFLELLGKACQRFGWRVFGYVLMGNHYHLLLETTEPNLSQGMHWLQTSYGTRHRLRHGLSGMVFGGRYKALLIERDGLHLGTVLDYLHLNPWRAGLVTLEEGLETYRWSSLPVYLALPRSRPIWLDAAGGLVWLDLPDTASGRRKFLQRIEDRASGGTRLSDEAREVETNWMTQVQRGWCFGGQRFREAMLEKAKAKLGKSRNVAGVDARVRKEVSRKRAEQLLQKGCELWGWEVKELQRRATGDQEKVVLDWMLREQTSVSLGWLSENLNLGAPAATCRLFGRLNDRKLLSKQERIWLKQLYEISI